MTPHARAVRSALGLVLLLLALPSHAAAKAGACVSPSGGDDTERLQAALDRCSRAVRACEVRLCAGVFETGILRVRDFNGTLRGAGREATVLRARPALEVNDNPDGYYYDDPFEGAPWPYLVQLVGGSGAVRDLAIEVLPPAEPGVRPTTGSFGGALFELWGALLITGKAPVAFDVERVRVAAGVDPESAFEPGTTTIYGIAFSGLLPDPANPAALPGFPVRGRLRVSDCVFEGLVSGTHLEELARADVSIWRNRYRSLLAVDLIDASRSRVSVLDNAWTDALGGVQVLLNRDGEPSTANEVLALGNRGSIVGDGAAVDFQDPFDPTLGPGGTRLSVLFNDWAVGAPGAPARGAILVTGATRASVQGNRVAGTAELGVSLDEGERCRVTHNDLSALETAPGPDVRLGEGTRRCLVVPGAGDTVLDLGTDNRVFSRARR